MKKNLLFIMPSLHGGGAEKSLVTLLSLIDTERYNVDLLLFRNEGLFADRVPKFVNVIKAGDDYRYFDGSAAAALKYFLSRGDLKRAAKRLLYSASLKIRDDEKRNKISWRLLGGNLPHLPRVYDASIGFLEGPAVYFCLDMTNAARHIGWLHTDYSRIISQKGMDEPYFRRLDCLVGVSAECCRKAESVFPFLRGKTVVIENIISRAAIESAARGNGVYDEKAGETLILTVGRLSPPKGIDLAVLACAELKKRGCKFKWHHIGKGELQDEIKALAISKGVADDFVFLGEKANPYPYIKQCDIYVQPSRAEGKSIAVDEAKCLAKPIVVTNFSTVADQVTDGVNGLIAEMSPESIADKICMLIDDAALAEKLSENLKEESVGNEGEIDKLYKLIEEM